MRPEIWELVESYVLAIHDEWVRVLIVTTLLLLQQRKGPALCTFVNGMGVM